jgi:threonine synthase
MGLGVGRLVVATNQNDILPVALATGRYARGGVNQTLSPSMDIQVSSNFERALFEAAGRDAARVRAWMDALARDGELQIDADALAALREWFDGDAVDDDTTLATIAAAHRAHGELLDPHTAVGVAVALRRPRSRPTVVLATAHPAKFAEAVVRATGVAPALPPALADLNARPERYVELPADAGAVSAWILSRARRGGAAGRAALPDGRG